MRVKTGTTRRRAHKKVVKANKGFRMTKRRLVKVAKEAALHAGAYAYHGRRLRKRAHRRLWIVRLNGGLKPFGVGYSQFIRQLKVKNIELDRKILAQIRQDDPKTFNDIVKQVLA